MKQFFKIVFGSLIGFVLGAFVLILLLAGIIAGLASSSDEQITVEANSILHIKLNQEINDRANDSFFENFDMGSMSGEKTLGLNQVLKALDQARYDENIKGIFLEIEEGDAGSATIEEIRNALQLFRTSGKFVYAYAEGYAQKQYYLSSAADKIYLNPQGFLDFRGLSAQVMFFKKALEKLDLEPQIIRHGQFKSAVEPLMLEQMSAANRMQTKTYLGSMWNTILVNTGNSRKVEVPRLNEIADSLLIRKPEDAVKYGLVDKLMYKDEVLTALKAKVGMKEDDKLKLVNIGQYADKVMDEELLTDSRIAVIYAQGDIESGKGDNNTIGSETIAKAIKDARTNKKVKAVVLRVNSPGGSALASDVMWRETILCKKEKPFIVSMGDVAASGGYYIACGADSIFASPNTITGSIGVFGVLLNGKKLLNERLGINVDTVRTNTHADLGAFYRPLDDKERAIVQQSVETVYETFITKVSQGRKMSVAEVDSIGQGRVWSGVDAKKIGLVDRLGGLNDAIACAARMAKLDKYSVIALPRQKDPLEQLMSGFSEDTETKFLKDKLGVFYKYFASVQKVNNLQGVQARMMFGVEIR